MSGITWNDQAPWERTSPEPRLRRMMLDDAPQAAALSQVVGWSHTADAWERLINWGGRGCFCVQQGDALIATTVAICYGRDRAWIGMVITHPDYQGQGHAKRLMTATLDFLRENGTEHILLDANDTGRPIYEILGFRPLYKIGVWEGPASNYLGRRARPLREADLPEVIALDAEVFGVARGRIIRRLVQDFPRLAWIDDESGQIDGFVLAHRRGEHGARIGPLMARTPWSAEKLLRTALEALIGEKVRIDIPDRNPAAVALAGDHNLSLQRQCTRMVYGNVVPHTEIITQYFGLASLGTG